MIYYSHRGNIEGSISEKENEPSYIDKAIKLGFHVEIDLIIINKALFLGHDFPQYKINKKFLEDRKSKLLIHAKNISALHFLLQTDYHYFTHRFEPFTYTSKKHIWIHDLSQNTELNTKSKIIVPLITKELFESYSSKNIYAVCTDYPEFCKKNKA